MFNQLPFICFHPFLTVRVNFIRNKNLDHYMWKWNSKQSSCAVIGMQENSDLFVLFFSMLLEGLLVYLVR